MLKIPYNIVPENQLKKISRLFLWATPTLKIVSQSLNTNLKQTGSKTGAKEYIAMSIASTIMFFICFSALISMIMHLGGAKKPILLGIILGLVISIFILIQQLSHPKILMIRKVRSLERNLLPAMQDMLIQLNSGVPLFNILGNIAASEYGEVSKEFSWAVKEINTGRLQTEVLEELSSNNPSTLFRRAIWQIVNGTKSGSDMAGVINDIIERLAEQQLIQIQEYGGHLSPLAMFYMLIAVIVPSLSITFIMILSSFISLGESVTKMILWGVFVLGIFLQIMFIGIIKSRRPNLLN